MVSQAIAGWALVAAALVVLAAAGNLAWLAVVVPLAIIVACTVMFSRRKIGLARARKGVA